MKAPVAKLATERKTRLIVDTQPTVLKQFNAACRLLGGTIQGTVNEFMRQTISRAGIDGPACPGRAIVPDNHD